MKPENVLLALVALSCAGCTPVREYAPSEKPEFVTIRQAKFYQYGPLQPGQPETLERETFVHLSTWEPGFSKVQLPDGRTGYVANEAIRLAPPAARAVGDEELFPERYTVQLPEPDLTMPVADIPDSPQKPPPSRR